MSLVCLRKWSKASSTGARWSRGRVQRWGQGDRQGSATEDLTDCQGIWNWHQAWWEAFAWRKGWRRCWCQRWFALSIGCLADVCTTKGASALKKGGQLGGAFSSPCESSPSESLFPLEGAMQLGGDEHTNCVATGMLLYFSGLLSRLVKNALNWLQPAQPLAVTVQRWLKSEMNAKKEPLLMDAPLRTHRWPHPGDIWPWWLERQRKGVKLLDLVPWMSCTSQSFLTPKSPNFPTVTSVIVSCFSGTQLLWFSGQFSRNQISRSQCISLTGCFFKSAIHLDKCGVYRSLNFCQRNCAVRLLALGSNPGPAFYYMLTLDKFLHFS